MYVSNWTCEGMDWRQLAIMIYYILNSENIKAYHITIPDSAHPFLFTMFREGNI